MSKLSWKSWLVILVVTLAAVFFALPNFMPVGFVTSGAPLTIRVRVADQNGAPIAGATVDANAAHKESVTDTNGQCEIRPYFRATGVCGRSGYFHVRGDLRVSAEGFHSWEKPFQSFLGSRYDYFHKGSSITCAVTLAK